MAAVVFDGDDTLWSVEHKYSEAFAEFFAYLYKTLGRNIPNLHFVYQVFFHIDSKNFPRYGIRSERITESMVETYRRVCGWVREFRGEEIYDPRHEDDIKRIGKIPFEVEKHHWFPGAEETLDAVLTKGHKPHLLTKYDRRLWQRKAECLRLGRFFHLDNILAVEGKKSLNDFMSLVRNADAEHFVAVGNSRDDLSPVEHYDSWRCFYILNCGSTVPCEADGKPTGVTFAVEHYDHPRVVNLKKIGDLVRYL